MTPHGDPPRDAAWRSERPVLVPTAQALGSVAVIRSLGRAGYPVHACASRPGALGLRSRYARAASLHPPYADPGYLPWLRQYVRTHGIRAIVPSEEFLLAVRPAFAELAHLLPPNPGEARLYAGLSKVAVFRALVDGSRDGAAAGNLPPTLVVDLRRGVPPLDDLRRLGTPLYVKVDAPGAQAGDAAAVHRVEQAEGARAHLLALVPRCAEALVQGHVPGRGVGAFFLLHQGKVVAELMHLRAHEVPHTGGVSSLRRIWWHEGVRDDALAKLRRLEWEGVAMMEYRWDPATDRFHFIELNGRFWGSLHLALFAGIDFPRLLLDAFHGQLVAAPPRRPKAVTCRCTFPMEAQYVWSRLKDPGLSLPSRLWSIAEFVVLSCDPRVRSDLLFPGDRGLYLESVRRFLGEQVAGWLHGGRAPAPSAVAGR